MSPKVSRISDIAIWQP